MTQATVNDNVFEISSSNDEIVLNGETFDWDIERVSESRFHIIKNNKSYSAEIVNFDEDNKIMSVKINNNLYEIAIKSKLDKLLEKLGMDNLDSQAANDIKAPMPGLILDIMVKIGDEVKKGDSVLILEAMKMENVLKSPADGVISGIQVEKGQSVEKNSILISF